jgi:predicted phage terminase large subunit-like protein
LLPYLTKQEKDELDRLLRSRESYTDFYLRIKPAHWGFPKHVEFLCAQVDKLVNGEYKGVTLSIPPGHAKTTTISHPLPIYSGLRWPDQTTVFTGYSQTFAERNLSRPSREIAKEQGILDTSYNAMEEWFLTNGARMVARGVGAAPTGINPIGTLITDDPINSRAQAESKLERDNIWDWWTGSIVQRFWPDTRRLVIATRWHHDDLIGRIKASGDPNWVHINLPAIAEANDPLGRNIGEALWPEVKPISFLEEQRKALGEYNFQSLFQGNPTPREGAILKVDKLINPPQGEAEMSVLAFDIASSEVTGDWTAAAFWEKVGGYYRLTLWRVKMSTEQRNQWMRFLAEKLNPTRVVFPQDPGSAGKDVRRMFERLFQGFAYEFELPVGTKEFRVEPMASTIESGLVGIVDNEHHDDAIESFRQFPNGKHDDFEDAAATGHKVLTRMIGGSVYDAFFGLAG